MKSVHFARVLLVFISFSCLTSLSSADNLPLLTASPSTVQVWDDKSILDTTVQTPIDLPSLPAPWTMGVWVKIDEPFSHHHQEVLLQPATQNDTLTAPSLNLVNADTGKVGYTSNVTFDFPYTLPIGHWVYLAFVGTSMGVTLYVDGIAIKTEAAPLHFLPMGVLDVNTPDFAGELRSPFITNRALNADEIKDQMDLS